MVVEPNVGLEITKGVGKGVVQELHGILELVCWWAVIMLATIYIVDHWGGNVFHWDGGGRVGWQSGGRLKVLRLQFVFVLAFRDNSSFWLNSLGPLCLWQGFYFSAAPLVALLIVAAHSIYIWRSLKTPADNFVPSNGKIVTGDKPLWLIERNTRKPKEKSQGHLLEIKNNSYRNQGKGNRLYFVSLI